ncbi:MAG: hypothetical protein AAF514_04400 [Verrucomicrobiota bacterium]
MSRAPLQGVEPDGGCHGFAGEAIVVPRITSPVFHSELLLLRPGFDDEADVMEMGFKSSFRMPDFENSGQALGIADFEKVRLFQLNHAFVDGGQVEVEGFMVRADVKRAAEAGGVCFPGKGFHAIQDGDAADPIGKDGLWAHGVNAQPLAER